MKVKWKNCFLCLNELSSGDDVEGKRGRRRRNYADSKLFFGYLLGKENVGNELVLQSVLKYFEPSASEQEEEGVKLHFCGNCRTSVELISRWHKQLEILQMRMIEQVKRVREVVLANSKLYGDSDGAKMCLQIFEEWLEWKKQRGEEGDGEGRQILDALYAFQTAVFESGKDRIDVPLVYLERYKCVPPPPLPSAPNLRTSAIKLEPGHYDDVDVSESQALPSFQQDSTICNDDDLDDPFFDNLEVGLSPSNDNAVESSSKQVQITQSPKRETLEKKTRKRKMASNGPSKVSNNLAPRKTDGGVEEGPGSKKLSIKTESTQSTEKLASRRSARETTNKRICKIEIESHQDQASDNDDDDDEFIPPTPKVSKDTQIRTKSPKKRGRKPASSPPPKSKCSGQGPRRGRGPYKKEIKPRVTDSYECALCSIKLVTVFKFEQHLRTHESESPDDIHFTCPKCDQRFSNQQHYELHLSFHERGAIKLHCEVCGKKFPVLEAKSHMESHSDKVLSCQHCCFCCISRERFLEHIKLHSTCSFSCDLCPQVISGRNKFMKHLHTVHQAIQKFRCEVAACGKEFIDKESLWTHNKKLHKMAGNEFICLTCNKNFCDASSLAVHERLHTGEKPFPCDQCQERFRLKAELERHQFLAHGPARVQCSYCGKSFADQKTLVSHTRLHEGTGFPCGTCGKMFGNTEHLKRHQIVHTDEKNFVCDECGKGFGTKTGLNKHLKIHIGDKKFKCTYCTKAFLFDHYLQDHLRIHTGEKPFVCDDCGKAFSQYAALFIHKKKHKSSGSSSGGPLSKNPPQPLRVGGGASATGIPPNNLLLPEAMFKIDDDDENYNDDGSD